jgi:hypothetical protein
MGTRQPGRLEDTLAYCWWGTAGATDPKGTMRPAVLGVKGTTTYSPKTAAPHGIPWGNYNSTCIDPADGLIFWTSQQYAIYKVPGQWSTCWTAFRAE